MWIFVQSALLLHSVTWQMTIEKPRGVQCAWPGWMHGGGRGEEKGMTCVDLP